MLKRGLKRGLLRLLSDKVRGVLEDAKMVEAHHEEVNEQVTTELSELSKAIDEARRQRRDKRTRKDS